MITPEIIRKKLLNHWTSHRFLKAEITGESFFPLTVPFRKPGGRELLENFEAVREWLSELKKGSRRERGYGYDIEFTSVSHRRLGPQQLPQRIMVADRGNFLRLIDKEEDYRQFREDLKLVRREQPQLVAFFTAHSGKLLKYKGSWPQLLAVCAYFLRNPKPGRYLRELDIKGVDSKFLEQHRKITAEMLDQLLPAAEIDQQVTGLAHHGFERRYGLKYDEPLIRFRILDPALCPMPGMDDLSIPVSRFCRLRFRCKQVIITENKINGLTFPPCSSALVIFGLGYGIRQLAAATWLQDAAVWYWGDIDTHGFSILAAVRKIFPDSRSFLMNSATLLRYKRLWGREEEKQHCLDELSGLDQDELELYNNLRNNRYGRNIRLEQERISFRDVMEEAELISRSHGSH